MQVELEEVSLEFTIGEVLQLLRILRFNHFF